MRGKDSFFPGDPDLQFSMRPSAETVLARKDFSITVRSNAFGFRDPDRGAKGEAIRILALGDSFTFGWGVEQDQTFEHQMEVIEAAARATHGGPPLEVINAGVPGYNLYQSVLALEKKGWAVDPDIVLMDAFVQNDFSENVSTEEWLEAKRSGTKPKKEENALAGWLETNSQAYVWLKVKYLSSYRMQRTWYKLTRPFKHKPREAKIQYRNLLAFQVPPPEEMVREWALAEQLLLRLRDDVSANGKLLVVVLLPPELQVMPDRWKNDSSKLDLGTARFDVDSPNRRVAAFCEREGIAVLDLLSAFREAAARGGDLYYPSDHHWTAAGHRLAAEVILADLRARGWLVGSAGAGGS